MEELLKMAAEAKGMPESLVKRSAEARAKAEGTTVEAVLAEWAGVEAPAAGDGDEQAADRAAGVAEAEDEAQVEETEAVDTTPAVEVLEPTAPPPPRDPTGDSEDEDGEDDDFATVSGTKRYPLWLTATFIVVPLIAVLYILVLPSGPECGSSGQLRLDPVTGEAVGCDGSPYGVDVVNNFSIGQTLYVANCAACHGEGGGGGAGPALAGGAVVETFPAGSCTDHALWVSLGSAGWGDERGPTYGATEKPVGGTGVLMPAFAGLTDVEVAQVTLYERVAFGNLDLSESEIDCGLADEDGDAGGGEATAAAG